MIFSIKFLQVFDK
jgi:hypothetical protein